VLDHHAAKFHTKKGEEATACRFYRGRLQLVASVVLLIAGAEFEKFVAAWFVHLR